MLKLRFLALSLTLIIILSSLFSCVSTPQAQSPQKKPSATQRPTEPSSSEEDIPLENKIVVGTLSSISGSFRFPAFINRSTEPTADEDIFALTNGYSTLATTLGGSYVWNGTVVKSHTEEQTAEGMVITIELNEDLLFSDGSPVKAANYLAYLLAFSSPVASAAGADNRAGAAFLGFEEFYCFDGANVGKSATYKDEDGSTRLVTASKTFRGIRLLGDYSFSLTINSDEYPSCFAYIHANVTPYDLELILGTDVTVKDDGDGVYLDGPWYERKGGVYSKAAYLGASRYDIANHAFSGPYVVSGWDPSKSECTLMLNPNYKGNYEGVLPSVEKVIYTALVSDTQLDALTLGVVDIISGASGELDVSAAIDAVRLSDGALAAAYYPLLDCKKLTLNCATGPLSFVSVRKALAYSIDAESLSDGLYGGYGSVLYSPFSSFLDLWSSAGESLEMTKYAYSLKNAEKALVEGGWIYNADGSDYDKAKGGVRYKKLSADEAEAYLSYSVEGDIAYKTEAVGEDYYLPLAISWLGLENDEYTALLSDTLIDSGLLSSLGIAVSLTLADEKTFAELLGQAEYGICSGADGTLTDILDPAALLTDDLTDEYDLAFPYGEGGLTLDEALERSGGKLGIGYVSRAMAESQTLEEYNEWWREYVERWSALCPELAICSPYGFTVYNAKIKGLNVSPYRTLTDALVYCSVK